MKFFPVIVYGFPTETRIEGGDRFQTAYTGYPGKLVYFVNMSRIVGENLTIDENYMDFKKFAREHNYIPGYMLAVIIEK